MIKKIQFPENPVFSLPFISILYGLYLIPHHAGKVSVYMAYGELRGGTLRLGDKNIKDI